MKRYTHIFRFEAQELKTIKRKMLYWAHQHNIFLFLDNNQFEHAEGTYECLMGAAAYSSCKTEAEIRGFLREKQDWLLGHITYDFKNQLERLQSRHPQNFDFQVLEFFQPEVLCYIPRQSQELHIESIFPNASDTLTAILETPLPDTNTNYAQLNFEKKISQELYLSQIEQLKEHIRKGDCYEINFCNEAYTHCRLVEPLDIFEKLNFHSRAPFAACYKTGNQYLFCASPERYLHKSGNTILAQPIKGTCRRDPDAATDEKLKTALYYNIKERAENVMIVDLMRNDLARFCRPGSVEVPELFGIYSFDQVHQMISSIKGQVEDSTDLWEMIRLSFPMGSMTGAPKIKVMELIDNYEASRRELFSGSVGYFSPQKDFDFNVIIRSLFYNGDKEYLSYQTGGAITIDSDPQQEWEETLLKASSVLHIFA